ncbi:MAG: UTP--glucose-1-phosphate uridylyltransferase GalU [Bacteroidales bacterium]|nr:UTP--glucose-1-phosphate uridylyltransferase GalU [Bacteroidales bacterium]
MVRKAVIPAAGFGTRFLPITKSQPKEMIPIVDTPTIQYVVEEAVSSGITDILMIIGKGKRAIEEHFDRSFELENMLTEKKKLKELEEIRNITRIADIHFIWQKEMNGLGDAIRYARFHVENEPFAVLLGDTVISGKGKPITRQLIDVYDKYKKSVVALEEVDISEVSRYGIISGERLDKNLVKATDFVEKPKQEVTPSRLAIASRYIFTPQIFDYLEKTKRGINNEIQLTDAMRAMVKEHEMYGLCFDGKRYDIGNKLDFLKTNIEFGLKNKEIGKELKEYLIKLVRNIT